MSVRNHDFNLEKTKEKDMTLSQAYRTVLIAIAGFSVTAMLQTRAVAQTKDPQVRNIVIVHGAWADGSSWSKVIPLLQAKGLHVVAVQNPLTSLADDVAATKRAIASQDGSVLLVGHSYGGAVITEAGDEPKVVGLPYVAAFAPSDGESVASVSKPFSPAPLGSEVRADAEGFLTVTARGIAEDFDQDLPDKEKQVLTATQGSTAAAVFDATITTAAWKIKPSWCVIATNDRAVPPELEKAEAAAMRATSITVSSSHVPMLSHERSRRLHRASRSESWEPIGQRRNKCRATNQQYSTDSQRIACVPPQAEKVEVLCKHALQRLSARSRDQVKNERRIT
jgi:pimeloyl-ACP methyl ester carboxylesterase